MSPLKKILSLSVGLVVLGTMLIVINTGTGSAQNVHLNGGAAAPTIPAIPVTVANTPLPVQGTVNANINGTPTVNANIARRHDLCSGYEQVEDLFPRNRGLPRQHMVGKHAGTHRYSPAAVYRVQSVYQ